MKKRHLRSIKIDEKPEELAEDEPCCRSRQLTTLAGKTLEHDKWCENHGEMVSPRWTLIQSPAWREVKELGWACCAVEIVNPYLATEIAEHGGYLFDDYGTADAAAQAENFPPAHQGKYPAVCGQFSGHTVVDCEVSAEAIYVHGYTSPLLREVLLDTLPMSVPGLFGAVREATGAEDLALKVLVQLLEAQGAIRIDGKMITRRNA